MSDVLRKARHRLALRWHPDKPRGDGRIFQEIDAAYQARVNGDPHPMTYGHALLVWEVFKAEESRECDETSRPGGGSQRRSHGQFFRSPSTTSSEESSDE